MILQLEVVGPESVDWLHSMAHLNFYETDDMIRVYQKVLFLYIEQRAVEQHDGLEHH